MYALAKERRELGAIAAGKRVPDLAVTLPLVDTLRVKHVVEPPRQMVSPEGGVISMLGSKGALAATAAA
jgi:hypothetical protein